MIGTGDYNGDGKSDILFQNSSGEVVIWELDGTTVIGSASLGNPGPTWHVQPDDGFYQPEHADLPWQTDGGGVVFLQNDSGEAFLWSTNGTLITGGGSLGNPGPDWHVKATGDFNGDGNPDLPWQNDTGEGVIWELNGTALVSAASLGNPGPSWHIISVGDFNHDSRSDILWQNSSGEAVIWEMNGTNPIAAASLGNPGPDWHVKARATSMATGFPTSCGRTAAARP